MTNRFTPTEVGEIPKDWDSVRLGEVSSLVTNGFVGVASKSYTSNADGVRYLLGTNVRPGRIVLEPETFVSKEFSAKNKKSILRTGDLLTVQSGHIGTTAVVPPELAGSNCHALIITRLISERASSDFVSQYLNSPIGQARLKGLHVGSSVPHINTSELADFRIPLPPLREQERIAGLASCWDRAQERVKALLRNSRTQKKGLMQRLLRAPSRPHSGSRSWKRARLGDVFERVTMKNAGLNQNVLTISGRLGLVGQRDFFNKNVASDDLSGYTLLRKGDFAYNKSYSNGYPMGAIKPLALYDEGVVSSLYICFRLKDTSAYSHPFFVHYFEAGVLDREIAGIAQEGARNHGLLNVGVGEFFELLLRIPDLPTQSRIAAVLAAADREIANLDRQLEVLQLEKRALMRQLFTGERRVKLEDVDQRATG